jgi:hypothetical protein
MSASPKSGLVIEIVQLLRLRRLRAEAARIELNNARARRDAAQQAVHEREALAQRLRVQRHALDVRVATIAPAMALLAPYASARREWLSEALERAEYALITDREDLLRAQAALDAAHAAWQKAMARCEAVAELETSTRRGAAQAANERAEREIDAPRRVVFQEMA